MCNICLKTLENLYPSLPKDKYWDFLMFTTPYPFGSCEDVQNSLQDLWNKCPSKSVEEAYLIAEEQCLS